LDTALAKETVSDVLDEAAVLEESDKAAGHVRGQAGNDVRLGDSHGESLNARPETRS
jgi:hypothetical protein